MIKANIEKGSIITLGEIMMRLTPPEYNTIEQSHTFLTTFGGGEANVAVSLSHLGHNTAFISRLPDNELGDSAIQYLRGHGVDTSLVSRGSSTMGIYFLEPGFGGRPSKVIYNRKHSAFTRIDSKEFDFASIFKDQAWLHLSGITLALGNRVVDFALQALKAAKEMGVKVSFDFNYRRKLWTLEEAKKTYPKVMPYIDVLFADSFDLCEILGLKKSGDELFYEAIRTYNLDYIFTKKRKIFSATSNSLSATVFDSKGRNDSEEIRFQIYDRIGAGDAFASGVIHGLLQDYSDPAGALRFGHLVSVLKHTLYGDSCTLREEDILDFGRNLGLEEVQR